MHFSESACMHAYEYEYECPYVTNNKSLNFKNPMNKLSNLSINMYATWGVCKEKKGKGKGLP